MVCTFRAMRSVLAIALALASAAVWSIAATQPVAKTTAAKNSAGAKGTAARKATAPKASAAKAATSKATVKSGSSRAGASKAGTRSTTQVASAAGRSVARRGRSARVAVKKGPSFQTVPSPERYQEIQKALADRGFYKGEVNGTWGPDSAEALKQFQASRNLPNDGKISSLSLIGLGLGPSHAFPGGTATEGAVPGSPVLVPVAPALGQPPAAATSPLQTPPMQTSPTPASAPNPAPLPLPAKPHEQ